MAEKSKPRAKNFSSEEINFLVDLILEKKSQLFGSLSASFNFEEKNTVWDEVASGLSTLHGTSRNRDDVVKKWSNLLSKHKPLIADKIASMKKTGGGPPGSELTPLEEKIQSIKGKKLFEGIASGGTSQMNLLTPKCLMILIKWSQALCFQQMMSSPTWRNYPVEKESFLTHYLSQLQICN